MWRIYGNIRSDLPYILYSRSKFVIIHHLDSPDTSHPLYQYTTRFRDDFGTTHRLSKKKSKKKKEEKNYYAMPSPHSYREMYALHDIENPF